MNGGLCLAGQTVTTIASSNDAADIVSRAFTTVAEGGEEGEPNVEYITMTPEEAAAAGVVNQEEDQVCFMQFAKS